MGICVLWFKGGRDTKLTQKVFFPDPTANAVPWRGSQHCRATFDPVQKRAGGKKIHPSSLACELGLGLMNKEVTESLP